jgi:NADH:ubiquinone oxidoreductase subunit B-like Fe-S oxidoreductase
MAMFGTTCCVVGNYESILAALDPDLFGPLIQTNVDQATREENISTW